MFRNRPITRNLSTLAEAIAANSTAALAFQNSDDAQRVLSAVAADPHVVAAAVYDSDGALFASYTNPATKTSALPVQADRDGYRFGSTGLTLYQPVVIENRRLGTLYLESDLGALYQRLALYAAVVLSVIVAAGLVVFTLATRLQRHITGPVLALAGTAKMISDQQDYSARAERFDNDELGQLTDAFNAMLARVQERDHALRAEGEALRESGERTRFIVDTALDAVVTIALLLKSLRDVLEGDGHIVVTASDGQGGIDTFQSAQHDRTPFDMVITDLGMPYVDGRRVASSVKEAASLTPVILLTGWGQRLVGTVSTERVAPMTAFRRRFCGPTNGRPALEITRTHH